MHSLSRSRTPIGVSVFIALTAIFIACSQPTTPTPSPKVEPPAADKIVFNANGGTGTMAEMVATEGQIVTLNANTFSRMGYTFTCWTTTANTMTIPFYLDGASYTKGAVGVTLYAYWQANQNTLKFDANGGTGTMSDQKVYSDALITLPLNTFTRANFEFNGWSLTNTGSTAYADKASFTMPTANTTILYAQWIPLRLISFNSQGGTACASQSIGTGKLVTEPASPSLAGNALEGWFVDMAYSKRWDFGADKVTGDMTLYAKWITATDGLAYTFINTNTEYNVAKGTLGTASTILIPGYWKGRKVTAIADSGFSGCSALTSIAIPSNVTLIGTNAFGNCSKLTSLSIPDAVTAIGDSAFQYCTGLVSIHLPPTMATLGNSVFYNCSSLAGITIPSGITSIAEDLFYGCAKLSSVIIPDGVKSISDWAFYQCSALTSVVVPDGVQSIGQQAFGYCTTLTVITLPDSVTSIDNYAFAICVKLANVTLPANLTTISSYLFQNCNALVSLTIPSKVKTIGDFAFINCLKLASPVLPVGVTSIGSGVFNNCSAMTSITLSDDLVTIGNNAFTDCSSLVSLTIPSKVTTIGYGFIVRTTALVTLTLNPVSPPTISGATTLLDATNKVTAIRVPSASGSLNAYKTTVPWSSSASIIVSQ